LPSFYLIVNERGRQDHIRGKSFRGEEFLLGHLRLGPNFGSVACRAGVAKVGVSFENNRTLKEKPPNLQAERIIGYSGARERRRRFQASTEVRRRRGRAEALNAKKKNGLQAEKKVIIVFSLSMSS